MFYTECLSRALQCLYVSSGTLNSTIPYLQYNAYVYMCVYVQASESGVHRPHVAGIHGRDSEGAYSIVLSGGYEDDQVSLFSVSLSVPVFVTVSLSLCLPVSVSATVSMSINQSISRSTEFFCTPCKTWTAAIDNVNIYMSTYSPTMTLKTKLKMKTTHISSIKNNNQ